MFHRVCTPLILLCATLAMGCRTEPKVTASNFSPRNTYSVAPKTLLDRVRSVVTSSPINLPIESDQDGRLVTGWQMHEGAKFGVAGLGRTYQERTQYTITVAPAWDDPANKGSVEVTEQTEQRPHANHDWGDFDPVKRPERAAELAKKIDEALQAETRSGKS
jgi:hypothetical protein